MRHLPQKACQNEDKGRGIQFVQAQLNPKPNASQGLMMSSIPDLDEKSMHPGI
jgi:hypothetical protein